MKHSILVVGSLALSLVGCDKAPASDATASATSSAKPADSSRAQTSAAPSASTAPAGPKEKSVTAKFCLGADGTSQDCAISCKIDKDPDTCARWAEKTKAICAKISKVKCQEICDKDENPTACELAKAMK